MNVSPKRIKYVIFSLIIIILSIFFNILNNKVKVHSLNLDKPLIITIDENLPAGEYYLEYYVACSGSNSSYPVLELTLKTIDSNGAEVLYDKQRYNKIIGFGVSNFVIKNIGDVVTAEFSKIEHIEGNEKSVSSAGVGNVYIRSKDMSYQKTVYIPDGIGKQALLPEHIFTVYNSVQLSDFATLNDYFLVGKTLELKILCTKETSDKYEIGLKISSDNINALPSDGNYYGFYPLTPDTDSWVTGDEYTQSIYLGLPPGRYYLEMVLSLVSPDIPYYINRYKLMDNKQKINIGNIDIHGQFISEFLWDVSDGQIVIISVMDEATNALNELSLHYMSELGFESDLIGKYRWSYIGITAKGVDGFTPLERLENTQAEVCLPSGSLVGTFTLPFDLRVISASFETGNTSSIKINENEYSQAGRGMNVVVFDINKNEVVSSVNFDTHTTNYN